MQFASLADALWFTLVTFSTVGYGDYSPRSHTGRALTSVAILLGVIFFAMPYIRLVKGGRLVAPHLATTGSSGCI